MQIMCLNGWGGKLHSDLLPYLADTSPDVLCLQEVVHSPTTEKQWLTYRDGDHVLAQRANFFRDVCAALPDHTAIFCPAAQGVLWNKDAAVPSQWGLATFVRKSLPIVGQVQGFVHKSYGSSGYGDHPRSRSAHGIRIYDHQANRPISITHMHGLRDLVGKIDTPERLAQVHKFLDMSKAVSEPSDAKVLCGDFNVEPNSETLSIMNTAGFVDLVTNGNFAGTRTSHYKKRGRFADYMLINDVEIVRDFRVVETPEVSDHCPLILII